MKQLIKKECCFTALPLTYLFLAFFLMGFVPGYPILMGGFFICLGLFQTMLSAREQQDLTFTLLLPVGKGEAVKAKYAFTVLIQLVYFLLSVCVTALRMTLLRHVAVYESNPMMNANPAYLGYLLLIFLFYNVFLLGGFWKDGHSLGLPFLRFSVAAALVVATGEALHHVPTLQALNGTTPCTLQWAVLAGSTALFVSLSSLSMVRSEASFQKVDL